MATKPNKDERQQRDATRGVFEEFFQDYFAHRRKVYWLNFVRGVFFGLGSVLGGTVVIAALLWVLSFLNQVPFLTEVVEKVQNSIEEGRR